MTTTQLLLSVLLLNFLIAVFYLIRMVHKSPEKRKLFFLESLYMILCPVVGGIFLFFSFVNEQLYFRYRRVDDISFFGKEKKNIYTAPDWETESNIVPLEEALLISGTENKRKELLHILKTDYSKSLSSVIKALEDPDSETSHYAASILMQEKSEIQIYIQKLQGACRDNSEDPEVFELYMDYLREILQLNIFSETEQKNYLYQLNELMEGVEKKWSDVITDIQILELGKMLMERKDYQKTEKWLGILGQRNGDTLEYYELQLRFYYATGQKHQFFTALERMKHSDISLNKDLLELVRYFSRH